MNSPGQDAYNAFQLNGNAQGLAARGEAPDGDARSTPPAADVTAEFRRQLNGLTQMFQEAQSRPLTPAEYDAVCDLVAAVFERLGKHGEA
ncbi:MAG: hypothetical protein M3069_29655 [Chloroflexota bacterium]|nr:hypothetical protein [Chloroflexota bacterium]